MVKDIKSRNFKIKTAVTSLKQKLQQRTEVSTLRTYQFPVADLQPKPSIRLDHYSKDLLDPLDPNNSIMSANKVKLQIPTHLGFGSRSSSVLRLNK